MAVNLYFASSNAGKLREFQVLAQDAGAEIALSLLPNFSSLPEFEETAPTFAENALGKAVHYSRASKDLVFADDSGLVVPSLGGAPGVQSARYAGSNATSAERIAKLLNAMKEMRGEDRAAFFVSAIVLAKQGRALAVITNRVNGQILESAKGDGGFGYDPVFYFPPLKRTFAEMSAEEKNKYSHRGRAFRRLMEVLPGML